MICHVTDQRDKTCELVEHVMNQHADRVHVGTVATAVGHVNDKHDVMHYGGPRVVGSRGKFDIVVFI